MKNLFLSLFLISLIVCLRLLPHPANIAPVTAVALTSGIYLKGNFRFIIPLLGMLISDFFIGFYELPIMFSVYLSFLIAYLIAIRLKNQKKISSLLVATIASSVIFFIITNLAVWLFGSWYGHDLNGFVLTYLLAIPFFKNTLLGDLFYTGILVSLFELASVSLPFQRSVSKTS